MNKQSNVLKNCEIETNKKIVRTLITTFLVMFVIWFLNLVGIFIHPQWQMNIALFTCFTAIILPVYLIKKTSYEASYVKYIVVASILTFVAIINVLLSYHAIIVFCFPMIVACMYYDRKLLRITAFLSIAVLSVTQILGQYFAGYPDINFSSIRSLVLFSVIPKALGIFAMYTVINMICSSIATMLENLMSAEQQSELMKKNSEIKEQVFEVSTELLASVESLDATTRVVLHSNQDIAEKSSEVLDSTAKNVSNIEMTNNKMQHIVQRIADLDDSNEQMAMYSGNVREKIDDNKEKIFNAIKSMTDINNSTEDCKEKIKLLEKQSQEIVNIINVITEISSQTKILSLNASIEAARAGESGKGFAVVAEEIQKLSDETRSAVDSIGGILEQIVGNTKDASIAMDSSVIKTKEGLASINDVEKTSLQINEVNTEMLEKIDSVYEITKEIKNSSKEIETYVLSVKDAMNKNLDIVEGVSATTKESNESTEVLVNMVETIKNMFEKLNNVLKY